VSLDSWTFLIELAILLLILAEAVWGVPAWRRAREEEKKLQERLANLDPVVAGQLRNLIWKGILPTEASIAVLTEFPPLIERDYTVGWRVDRELKKSLRKWASKKTS